MTTQIARGRVVIVDRGRNKHRAGSGLLKGMGIVWQHWRQSFQPLDSFSQIAGTFTEEYPEERPQLPEAYRNMPVLLYDDETGQELCTSCFQCQRICPPQVIHMTQAKDPNTGKPVPAVAEFIIEYDACMSCGFCAEVCPFDAIKMDHAFELSTAEHPRLTVHKAGLLRPVSYYESLAPMLWDEVKASAYKKLPNNIKRRPGLIGIAPQMVEQIKAARAAAAVEQPTPSGEDRRAATADQPGATPAGPTDKAARLAAIRAAKAAQKASESGASQPDAAADTATPTDKAARLAAIRAANAAKQAGAQPAEPPASAPGQNGPTDKAARLAAIRAANAAKKGEGQPAEPSSAAPGPEAPGDKAARLAAIRAANAAKKDQAHDAPAPETTVEPVAETNTPMPADKAARLAAIRAANAAKKDKTQ